MRSGYESGTHMEDMDLFYEDVRKSNSRPLWVVNNDIQRTRPQPSAVPFMWKWRDFSLLLHRAAQLVPIEDAERRVLVFANPGLEGRPAAVPTLMANLQIIKPGEIAPSHRHTMSAFRVIVEGKGAYTTVEGEKTYMDPGDFVTTPNWTWHDHGHEGEGPMVWLDGLDVPLVRSLDANFYEEDSEIQQPLTKPDDGSLRLYGAGSLTPTWQRHQGLHSPLLNYKYERSYEALSQLAQETEGSPYDGVCLEYTNPVTGGPCLATIACFVQLMLPGRQTKAHRHTGNTIYHVIKGNGHSVIGGQRFDWEGKDTFVVPSWTFHEHVAQGESVLFSYSDRPVLQPFGLYREEAYEENGGYQPVTGVFEGAVS